MSGLRKTTDENEMWANWSIFLLDHLTRMILVDLAGQPHFVPFPSSWNDCSVHFSAQCLEQKFAVMAATMLSPELVF